jgi:hypothetical protein
MASAPRPRQRPSIDRQPGIADLAYLSVRETVPWQDAHLRAVPGVRLRQEVTPGTEAPQAQPGKDATLHHRWLPRNGRAAQAQVF